jgi:predicted enzyme related to lactoylglutathione lyase
MGQQVVHVEVVGKDGKALREYYGELFGWKFSEPMGPTDYSVLEEQEGVGGGVGEGPEDYAGHVTFYVQVPDVGAALEKAESLGGSRMMGPDEVPGVGIVIGLFSDPEGHVIGVMSPTSEAS